ncbi:Uncharacterised protein [Mycobacteroides abscessus subsp. abscessus]|nr:Uncharacterised protein [Mycobacteroides abscessus subsp. abscessus]
MIDALDDGVVIEHAARGCANPHGQHPLGLGHLVVDLAQHRGHLLAHSACHDHQVCLARRGRKAFHAKASNIESRARRGHHLDGATGQTKGGGPQRAFAHIPRQRLDGTQQKSARQFFLKTHGSPDKRAYS